jgi:hypothetical protein
MTMNRCRKLSRAYELLLELLARGPVPIAMCLERGRALGLGEGAVRAARKRLPIRTVYKPITHGANYWELTADVVDGPPAFWRTRNATKFCIDCRAPLAGRHYLTLRCRSCKLKVNAARRRVADRLRRYAHKDSASHIQV